MGRYARYRVQTRIDTPDHKKNSCTCWSEYFPCKHMHALVQTYQKRPQSFVDVEPVLAPLQTKSAAELLNIIQHMVEIAPTALHALGVKGFEEKLDDEEDPEM